MDDETRRYIRASAELALDYVRKSTRERIVGPLREAREAVAGARESPPAVAIEALADATERLIAAIEEALHVEEA
jgi:hypothetical protein